MIASRPILTAALLCAASAASAAPPYAVQRIADGTIVTRTYAGAPYEIPGYRWLEVQPVPLPPVTDGVTARLPCSTVPVAERVESTEAGAIDCVDSAGADEWVQLITPAPTDPATAAGTLHTGIVQVGWQDTGDEPAQALHVLGAKAIAAARQCRAIAASPTICDDLGGPLAIVATQGAAAALAEPRVQRCSQAAAACDIPAEANRDRLEGMLRAAYAAHGSAPDLDLGWPVGTPLPAQPPAQ